MMAPSSKQLSQKEYLKKYLNKKKKKKPRRNTRRENVKLIDDDAVNRIDDNPFDDFEDAEDAPCIAGYYDERPTEVKLLENYRNVNRWQPMPGAEIESDRGNQKSRPPRDGLHSPTANRRERYDEDSRGRKRKHRSTQAVSPRSKRLEVSPSTKRTSPRIERRMEERGGYSPARRGDHSKFEEQRSFSDLGQRFRDDDNSPRRINSGRYNGGNDSDRYRAEEQIYDERFARNRQRQRSIDSGSPNLCNQRMDDKFRGSVRRGDPHLSPFSERDRNRFEQPLSPAPRRKERQDDRRYADEGRREFAPGDHRMPSRNQRNRHHTDVESPPLSKHQPSSRGDDRFSSKIGVNHRHNSSPPRTDRRLSPDRRISPPRSDRRMSPPRNERRLSPPRNDRRVSPPRNDRRSSPSRNDRRLSPSPRANLDDNSWRRSFSPAPTRRYHSPMPTSDGRRADRRDDKSPVRGVRSRNERPPSPTFRVRDGHRIDEDSVPSSFRRKDRSQEDRLLRDRRREVKDLPDIRDVPIDLKAVQEARVSRDPRETTRMRDPRYARETFKDTVEHRRDRVENKEPVRIIEWKEKSTAVSRSVPAKRVADPSPPPRLESPRRREASLPSRKHKDKSAIAGTSTRKTVADEHHRSSGKHETTISLPPAKHKVSKHESHIEPPSSSPKHRISRHEPHPSTPPSRHREESKQRTHSHKHNPLERDPRARRSPAEFNEVAVTRVKNADRLEKRSGEDASSKGAKKRDREDREHEKSGKSSRSKDEKFGLLSTKKSSSKPEDKLSDEQAGKNATTIYRDAKTGKKRDLQEEKLEKIEKRRQEDKKMEQYYKWGRGLKQVAEEDERLKEEQYEMSKPLARYADDDDLDKTLKRKEISGLDPMLEYINRKKRKKEAKEGKVARPQYKGSWPPNRFNIPPGHKWDGVDRSNGYENRYFAKQSDKKAMEEEAYKWCSEDM